MPDPATVPAAAAEPAAAFCLACGYSLRGLPSGKCPECGRPFDLADRRTVARRPPRLTLRRWAGRIGLSVLALTLAAGSVPGWYWWGWHREQAAIAAVRGAGGYVAVERADLGAVAKLLPGRWAFLRDRADSVNLVGEDTAVLDHHDLSALVHVRTFWLLNSRVTDAALADFEGMTQLQFLSLADNPRLDGTGLRHLAGLRALIRLSLRGSGLSDAGLAEVGGLPSLRNLDIRSTAVTDAGMAQLAHLTSLQFLYLNDTGLTDAGLVPLRGLTSLRFLHLRGTKVTEQGRRDLEKALPDLTIYY